MMDTDIKKNAAIGAALKSLPGNKQQNSQKYKAHGFEIQTKPWAFFVFVRDEPDEYIKITNSKMREAGSYFRRVISCATDDKMPL